MRILPWDIQRFWSKVVVTDGCWEWNAGKFQGGYGAFHLYGKLQKAHRISWLLQNGGLPEDALVCHHCDNPSCVRPDHLYIGTPQSNMDDKMRRGRHVASPGEKNGMWGVRKTHCKQGHELSEDNVVVISGVRKCRICKAAAHKRWYESRGRDYYAERRKA